MNNKYYLIFVLFLFSFISVSALTQTEYMNYNFNRKLNGTMILQIYQPKDYGFKYYKERKEIVHTLEVNKYGFDNNWQLTLVRANWTYKYPSSTFIQYYVSKNPKYAKDKLKNDTLAYYKSTMNQTMYKYKNLQYEALNSNQIDLIDLGLKW